jgi:alkylglycerol monooxygenase
LAFDAWHAKSWIDKMRIWFMPTGWRPADVAARFERSIIEDVYAYQKYHPKETSSRKIIVFIQFLLAIGLLLYFFSQFSSLETEIQLLTGGLIFLMVMGYSSLMDGSKWALLFEGSRLLYLMALYILVPTFFSDLALPFSLLIGVSSLSAIATKVSLTHE